MALNDGSLQESAGSDDRTGEEAVTGKEDEPSAETPDDDVVRLSYNKSTKDSLEQECAFDEGEGAASGADLGRNNPTLGVAASVRRTDNEAGEDGNNGLCDG